MKRIIAVLVLVVLVVSVSVGSLIAKPDKPFKGDAEGTSTAATQVPEKPLGVFANSSDGTFIGCCSFPKSSTLIRTGETPADDLRNLLGTIQRRIGQD